MQVDPTRPSLIAPVSMRLKLYHEQLQLPSNFAFDFNLRHYIKAFYRGFNLKLLRAVPAGPHTSTRVMTHPISILSSPISCYSDVNTICPLGTSNMLKLSQHSPREPRLVRPSCSC